MQYELGKEYWLPFYSTHSIKCNCHVGYNNSRIFDSHYSSCKCKAGYKHKTVVFPVRGKLISYDVTYSAESVVTKLKLEAMVFSAQKEMIETKRIFESLDECQKFCEEKNINGVGVVIL